jgi:hypothetical protein
MAAYGTPIWSRPAAGGGPTFGGHMAAYGTPIWSRPAAGGGPTFGGHLAAYGTPRRRARWILPLEVLGSSETKSIWRGYL